MTNGKIPRKAQKIFGSNAGSSGITKFGSVAAGSPAFSTDLDDIQSLTAYQTGWLGAVMSGTKRKPVYQDRNALDYLFSFQLANIFQDGIPVYNSTTIYYTGSIVRQDATSILYKSITDSNTGNLLTDNTKWQELGDLANLIRIGIISTLDTSNMPIIANNTVTPNTQIDFSSGFCYDVTENAKITNTAMTKKLDAVFAAGTGNGGLDTGTKAVSTWYHCFAISKADGTADFLFSISATAPTMPSAYINKRRIGSIKTDSSGNIKGFTQVKNTFIWSNPLLDFAGVVTDSSQLVTVSSPPSVKTKLNVNTSITGSGTAAVLITSPDSTDLAVSGTVAPLAHTGFGSNGGQSNANVFTNTTSQIRLRAASATTFYLSVISYEDMRGVN